jgi:hypothetical protein
MPVGSVAAPCRSLATAPPVAMTATRACSVFCHLLFSVTGSVYLQETKAPFDDHFCQWQIHLLPFTLDVTSLTSRVMHSPPSRYSLLARLSSGSSHIPW